MVSEALAMKKDVDDTFAWCPFAAKKEA